MTVTVTPETFQFVCFDSGLIQRIAEGLASALQIGRPIHVEVDETTPLARVRVELDDTIVVRVESGAFEDMRRPREQSERATATALGRALLRANDRLVGGFGEAPADDELSLAQVAAWETYCTGRLQRLGVDQNVQRWRYNFRNRHGFTDIADRAFEQLWQADGLTWAEVSAISASATAASGVAA
jgi:hypothetical protein